jgi:tRNA modification GTPase
MRRHGNETIAAIATASGGGIGIVRVSGPDALALAGRIFRGRGGHPLAAAPPFRLVLGTVSDLSSGTPIDEVLAVHMPAGRSYTGEPTVEIQAHGGRAVLEAVLLAALDAGARPAGPGEFTRRAYLSGRIDLTQAEAVAALVAAQSDEERRCALQQLQGAVAGQCRLIRDRLVDLVSRIDAALDLEDGECPGDIPGAGEIAAVAQEMLRLAGEARGRRSPRGGVRVVFAGRTNSGKSSIFNYLLDCERSIVSALPGTTRDYVEERSAFGGASVTLVDTAGFRMTDDSVEAEGVRRSLQQLSEADIVVLVLDGSEPYHPDDGRLLEMVSGLAPIVAVSKADLPLRLDHAQLGPGLPKIGSFSISTLTGEGCARFAEALAVRCRTAAEASGLPTAAPSERHRAALLEAAARLGAAADRTADLGGRLDQVAHEVHAALRALGEITGETATDEILDRIFSRFCIGK